MRGLDIDTVHIRELDLKGCLDEDVVERAMAAERMIVTLDRGFGRLYYFRHRKKVGIIVVRSKNQTVGEVNRVLKKFITKTKLKGKLKKSLIILDSRKVRIRH